MTSSSSFAKTLQWLSSLDATPLLGCVAIALGAIVAALQGAWFDTLILMLL